MSLPTAGKDLKPFTVCQTLPSCGDAVKHFYVSEAPGPPLHGKYAPAIKNFQNATIFAMDLTFFFNHITTCYKSCTVRIKVRGKINEEMLSAKRSQLNTLVMD